MFRFLHFTFFVMRASKLSYLWWKEAKHKHTNISRSYPI